MSWLKLLTSNLLSFCSRYVSPDYASTGMLNEGSDVYSFGVLLMEMITGRSPIDYSRPAGEVKQLFLCCMYIKDYTIVVTLFLLNFSDELG